MPIEIEKKYRLTKKDRRAREKRMRELGYEPKPIEFEENTIYGGGRLNFGGCALRLRRINGNERAYLTFKRRIPAKSSIKHQEEHEVTVADPRSEEHTSELQSRFGIPYAVFCLK